ncbi:transport-associated protein [uncultured Pseudodesulfovibrio sp.]|uniref:transport-associated protein n=1 Tax=uncultured Pseudodesulfovibrio sp. TaxID=2035858 RepID=UPI0029C8DE67|nr:transport-associated protein [uncultured Pseudodesulfovibrio sp.]
MKVWKKILVIGCLLAMMVPTFGCSEEGTMEKAGKKLDQAAEDASDAAEDAKDAAKKLFE